MIILEGVTARAVAVAADMRHKTNVSLRIAV